MSDIRIKMAKDLRDMSDMVGDLHWMAAKAVEDLTKKDGEIAKRDEVIVGLANSRDFWREKAITTDDKLSAIKAQGVVMPELTEREAGEYGEAFARGFKAYDREFKRLNAAPVQRPKCKTCDDNGRIGGPSFYAPDEGGDPCPDCCAPVQQVSVPDGWKLVPDHADADAIVTALYRRFKDWAKQGFGPEDVTWCEVKADILAMLAAPAAPAADAGLLDWAVDSWHREVSFRPLVNVHRSALDGTWRQVIRKFGGDPVDLCGPSHFDLINARDFGHD